MLEEIKATASFLKEKIAETPGIGIILGTGLGGLGKEIEVKNEFPYSSIPNFPVSTVQGHSGKLLFGKLGGK
ncbi:MAG TPA: purine-nucleoside phosphorylase, partial [Bacteroidia bacterium]